MFTELHPLLTKRSFVLILTGQDDGKIRCNFVPKSTDKDSTEQDKALLVPLTITGTPAELDEGLAGAISSYVESYQSMQESVDATKAQMAAAKAATDAETKAKADAAKTKKAGARKPAAAPEAPGLFGPTSALPTPPLSSSKPEEDDNDEDNDDEEES